MIRIIAFAILFLLFSCGTDFNNNAVTIQHEHFCENGIIGNDCCKIENQYTCDNIDIDKIELDINCYGDYYPNPLNECSVPINDKNVCNIYHLNKRTIIQCGEIK